MDNSLSLPVLFESHPDPMWVYELKTLRILDVNNAAVAKYGYTREEFLTLTIADLRPDEDLPALMENVRAVTTGIDEAGIWRHRLKSGDIIHVEIRSHTLDHQGRPAELVSARDVTRLLELEYENTALLARAGADTGVDADARPTLDILLRSRELKSANSRLQEQEANLRTAQRLLGLGIWKMNTETGELTWTDNIYDMYGVHRKTFGHDFDAYLALVHPDDREQMQGNYVAFAASTEDYYRFEHRIVRQDGRVIHVRGIGELTDAPQGRILTGVVQDVTERVELEDRLRQSQKLEAVGQLTGGVAHDFNNLLTVILGNAELLTEQLSDQRQLRTLAEMTATAAERGAELTHRLLAFARRQALDPRPVNVNHLVTGMDPMLRRTLTEDLDIEVVQAVNLWRADVDPGQLEVSLLNLAINSRDAMPGGGCLTIETANCVLDEAYANAHEEVTAGQYVMVSVSDTGTGMTPETLVRAFEPFFTTKPVGKGSGLGLSMVYGFIKQSGGHIRIYSEVDHGTTIKLYLPRSSGPDDDLVQDQEPGIVGGSEHILVVEDDYLVREHLVAQLRELGYRVTAADSAPPALEILEQVPDIDLLFTDIVMPGGMNGRQLADAAQVLRPGLKVLFTSGYTENAIVHHGRLDRGVHLLSKPYRRQEVAAKVRMVLDESGDEG